MLAKFDDFELINYIEGLSFLCLARSWLLFQNIRTIAGAKGDKWSCCTPILVDVDTTKISLQMVTFCVCLFFTPKQKKVIIRKQTFLCLGNSIISQETLMPQLYSTGHARKPHLTFISILNADTTGSIGHFHNIFIFFADLITVFHI